MNTIYERIIFEGKLYPKQFVEKFGICSPFWYPRSTWQECELFLRHHFVCNLICNTELDYEELSEPGPSKRGRYHSPEPSPPQLHIPEEEGEEEELNIEDPDIFMEEIEEHIEEIIDMPSQLTGGYRYICLEGESTAEYIQNSFARKYKLPVSTSKWDILDTVEKKYIEVKITKLVEPAYDAWYAKKEGMGNSTSLIWIDPDNGAYDILNHDDTPRGMSKVVDFILQRRHLLQDKGIIESSRIEDEKPYDKIFTCNKLNDMVEEWTKIIVQNRNQKLPENYNDCKALPVPFSVDDILKHMDKCDQRVSDPIIWKPKILPPHWGRFATVTRENRDDLILRCFMDNLISDLEVINKERSFNNFLLKEILFQWNLKKDINNFNFNFITRAERRNEMITNLLDALGIGMKKRLYNPEAEDLKQPEYKLPEKKRYDHVFDHIMDDLTKEHEVFTHFSVLGRDKLIISDHPIDIISSGFQQDYYRIVSQSNIGAYLNSIINFYSRLGGAYSPASLSNKGLANVVIFPLYCIGYDQWEDEGSEYAQPIRYIQGIAIRGPHHAKQATDKINLVIIEKIATVDSPRIEAMMKYTNRVEIFTSLYGFTYYLTTTAINRQDPSYNTFVLDALFVPANMIGEMTLNRTQRTSGETFYKTLREYTNHYKRWILSRVVDSTIMALCGGSQEEGALAILRKLVMYILDISRGNIPGIWNLKELVDSLNECLIDRPLAMYFSESLRYSLERAAGKMSGNIGELPVVEESI